MKKLLVMLVSVAALAGCGSCGSTKATGSTSNEEAMGTIHLNKADFIRKVADINNTGDWQYLGDKPAVIDFYADWCGPCRAIAPSLEELAAEYGDRVYIYKINIDDEPELAGAFNVQSIPTLIFVPMNGTPHRVMGALPKNKLAETIDSVLIGK